jgi:hypothetical protein
MSTLPLRRSVAALVAVSSLFFVQACYAYQRPLPGKGISFDSRVRVQATEPFAVMPVAGEDTAGVARDCHATTVEGYVTSASADSVTFQSLISVVPANGDAGSCRWTKTAPVIVPVTGADVAVNRPSGKRMGIVLLVTTATLFALIAYAMSNMDWSWDKAGDCAFC